MGVSYSKFFVVYDADRKLVAMNKTFDEALKAVPEDGIVVSVERTKVIANETLEVVKEVRKVILG